MCKHMKEFLIGLVQAALVLGGFALFINLSGG